MAKNYNYVCGQTDGDRFSYFTQRKRIETERKGGTRYTGDAWIEADGKPEETRPQMMTNMILHKKKHVHIPHKHLYLVWFFISFANRYIVASAVNTDTMYACTHAHVHTHPSENVARVFLPSST